MWKTALVFHSSKGHANKLCIMQSSAAAASLKDAAEGQCSYWLAVAIHDITLHECIRKSELS